MGEADEDTALVDERAPREVKAGRGEHRFAVIAVDLAQVVLAIVEAARTVCQRHQHVGAERALTSGLDRNRPPGRAARSRVAASVVCVDAQREEPRGTELGVV